MALETKNKKCTTCKKVKEEKDFPRGARGALCKDCKNEYARKTYDPEKQREKLYIRRYGITIKDYNEMYISQDGKCAICEKEKTIKNNFYVDHCHKTKKVRGLLCMRCNSGIGYFKDDESLMKKAIVYLKNSTKNIIVN